MTLIQDQTGPAEEPVDRAQRDGMPGQTTPAEQRVVRPAPARTAMGFPPPSRGSVVAEAGATLGIALSGISRNKARTTLTLLGMIIGVASVITAVGIGTGQAAQVNAQISSLGTNLVTVQPGASFSGGVRGGVGSANTLTQADVNALAAQIGPGGGLPDVASIAPEDTTSVQAVAGTNNTATQADGVTPEILTARNYQVAVGRFITANDVQRSAQVADLGATLAAQLFPNGLANAVGSTIQLNGQAYQVIGVMALKGGFGNTDTNVFVPITAVQNRLSLRAGAANTVTAINLVAAAADKTDAAQAEVYQNNIDQKLFVAYNPPQSNTGTRAGGTSFGSGGFGGASQNAPINAALTVGNPPSSASSGPGSTSSASSGSGSTSSTTGRSAASTSQGGAVSAGTRRALSGQLLSIGGGTLTVQSFLGQESLPMTAQTHFYRVSSATATALAVGQRVAIAADRADPSTATSVTIAPRAQHVLFVRVRSFSGSTGGFGSGGNGGGFGSGGFGSGGTGNGFGSGTGGFGRGAGLAGTITALGHGTITVKTQQGGSQTIKLTALTAVYRVIAAPREGLKAGSYVSVGSATVNGRQVAADVVEATVPGTMPTIMPTA